MQLNVLPKLSVATSIPIPGELILQSTAWALTQLLGMNIEKSNKERINFFCMMKW
jgi:hypothetical protein